MLDRGIDILDKGAGLRVERHLYVPSPSAVVNDERAQPMKMHFQQRISRLRGQVSKVNPHPALGSSSEVFTPDTIELPREKRDTLPDTVGVFHICVVPRDLRCFRVDVAPGFLAGCQPLFDSLDLLEVVCIKLLLMFIGKPLEEIELLLCFGFLRTYLKIA
jgi:hypothetical protein